MQQTNNKLTSNNSANSICIPRAFANISEARVRKVFDALNIFQIDRVDMIQRKNEKVSHFSASLFTSRRGLKQRTRKKHENDCSQVKNLKLYMMTRGFGRWL